MGLSERERTALAALAASGLVALGLMLWQRRTPPLVIEGTPSPVQAAQWDAALQRAREVDVNVAGLGELERLPGIGPTLARRIVAHRTAHGRFDSPEELTQVPGIGPKTLQALQDHVKAADE